VIEPICHLRPYERRDGRDFAALLVDDRVMRYIGDGRPFDAARASHAFDEEVFAKSERDPSCYIGAISVAEQYAGHAELFRRTGRREYELFYLVLPQFWRRGIGSRVVDLLLEEARSRGLPFVTATVHPQNTKSLAILTRRSFVPDARLTADLGFPAYRLDLR
jgi:RimJ/RimL family protein N-acetyltransferase